MVVIFQASILTRNRESFIRSNKTEPQLQGGIFDRQRLSAFKQVEAAAEKTLTTKEILLFPNDHQQSLVTE